MRQPPGHSRSCAASGVRERQTPGDGARLERLRVNILSHCAVCTTPPAAKLHRWACNNVGVMFEQVPQPVRQPADAHMQEHTMAAKVPTSG